MKILLGDFHAKVGRENIFQPTIGNECMHLESNENGITLVNSATSKNLIVKSTKFPHRNIHKCSWKILIILDATPVEPSEKET